MYLLSVTLTNFKAHRDRNFEFQLGTNAICGVNGAGKTSILEAVAWVLFNHRGNYKQEDLVRNGSGSAQVRVAFVSSYDGRTYEVERCTSRGYTLFDPQLEERLNYSRIKDEIEPWLHQHLGVPVGTDLGQLFANTIGVPQGTFTADFLLSPEKRKPIFDTVLKVEEYRRVHKDSNSLRRYAEAQVELLKTQLQQYEEQLHSLDDLQVRYETISQEIVEDEQQFANLRQELTHLQGQRDLLTAQTAKIQTLQQQQKQLELQLEAKRQAQQVMEQSRLRAQQATELCHTHVTAYRSYLDAEATLKTLTQKNNHRQKLLQQQQTQQRSLDQQAVTIAGLQAKLEQRSQIKVQLLNLATHCDQQDTLTTERRQLTQQQQELAKLQLRCLNLKERLAIAEQEIQKTDRDLQALASLRGSVETIPELEQQQQRWQQQLSRVEAAQQFELELRQLVDSHCSQTADYDQQAATALVALEELQQSLPLLSSDTIAQLKAAIATGQTLSQNTLSALESILGDLSAQVDTNQLKRSLASGQAQLNKAYGDKAQLDNQKQLEQRRADLLKRQTQLQANITQLEQQLAQSKSIEKRLSQLADSIELLGDPKSRRQVLQEQLQGMANSESEYERLCTHRRSLEATLAELSEQLKELATLDDKILRQQQLRQKYQPSYLTYIQNEKDAQSLEQLSTNLAAVNQDIAALEEHQKSSITELQMLAADFDPTVLQQIEQRYVDVKSRCDRIAGSLPQQRKLQTELADQLITLRKVKTKRDQTQADLKQTERTKRFINFARKAYKEAGPRITERYVYGISQEADRLFRELLNRSNVSLEWTRDYEIVVQEGGNTRRFINLSGGEQMCAALAVRLALLKVLADIDIAFFDEPTTNMDRPRRESLAEAIARLKTFKQLFVISHDDTFEKVTDNVIVVERDD
ncbi:MAG: AAA family ATPase [Leptolyngbyaceae cyanobacterium]